MRKLLFLLIGAMLSSELMAAPNQTAGRGGLAEARSAQAAPDRAADDVVLGLGDSQAEAGTDSAERRLDETAGADTDSAALRGARFTLKHELASRIRKPNGVANDRTSFRMEYEKYFLDNFYLHFDVMETAFWSNDHRALARGTNRFVESTVRDAYLQFSKADTSVKIGRQILIWGESDAGAITDVIAPRNLSELFFISLEASRISQFMLTVDQFTQVGDWSIFYTPRAQFNKYPETGDIYAVDPFGGNASMRTTGEAPHEYGLRWKRTFGRSDIGLMAASLIDNDYAIHQDGFTGDGKLLVKRDAQRFHMIGATFNLAGDGFLLTGEIARKSPKAFVNPASLQLVKKDIVDTSVRMEYSLGNGGNHAVSLEAVNNRAPDWSNEILPTRKNMNSLVAGWRNSFLNDTLSANWLTVYNRTYTSFTHSLFLNYKLSDRVSLSLDAFYLNVANPNNSLYPFRGESKAVFRVLYPF